MYVLNGSVKVRCAVSAFTWQVGDWTKELFRLGLEQDRLPLWITAAQPSLMEKSIYYDNSKNTTYIYLTTPCLLLL